MRPNRKSADGASGDIVPALGSPRPTSGRTTRTGTDDGSEMLHIRVDRALKREAATTLEGIGLSMSDAVRLFLNRVVIEQALPLQLNVPNATTRAAIKSARSLGPGAFSNPQELFDGLEKGRRALNAPASHGSSTSKSNSARIGRGFHVPVAST